jgi:hypothetical protein
MTHLESLTETARLADEILAKLPPGIAAAYKPSRNVLAEMIAKELAKQVNALVKPWP